MAISVDITNDMHFLVVSISGRIITDEGLNSSLQTVEAELSAKKFKAIVCSCSKLEYANSTGLNFFIRLLTRARKQGIDCVLVDLQPVIARLFEVSKLNEIFSCFHSFEEVKTKFQ